MKLEGIGNLVKSDKTAIMEQARQLATKYKHSKTTTIIEKTTVIEETIEYSSIPNEDWRPSTACKICRGAGYLKVSVPFGHPDFNKLLPCECKVAEQQEIHQRSLIASSGILNMEGYANASFDDFEMVPGVREAFTKALCFAERPKGWLVFLGPNGCGKTLLEAAIANKRIAEKDTVMIQTCGSLLASLRTAFSPNVEVTYDDKFAEMQRVGLLIIDDYGAHNTTSWAEEKLFELLNYRYNNNLPLVMSSNDISLMTFEPRIRSRLSDRALVTQVKMDKARDYRPFKNDGNIVEG
jgi:DNA replication protein DnaC